jgi:phospholipase/lecithinase/hemolysin
MYSSVVVYGDSLSDNGNLFAATGNPGSPYYNGRPSNGPVAVEHLAAALNDALLDFAWTGATTGIGNHLDTGGTPTSLGIHALPGMANSYAATASSIAALAPTALFVVWGEANDFLSPSPLDITPMGADNLAVADRAANNLVSLVNALTGLGAKHILAPGLPDLGLTPVFQSQGPAVAAQASALTDYFNFKVASSLGSEATYFDTAGLLRAVVANPGAYGFTNVTTPCFDLDVGSVCATPDSYLFWDELHPSARAHQVLGEQFFAASVPEPGTLPMVIAACGLLLAARCTAKRTSRRWV